MDIFDTPAFLFFLAMAVTLGSVYIYLDAMRDLERQRQRLGLDG